MDSLEWEDDRYVLAGDWGHIDLRADAIEVVLGSEA
jgi:hypothetical protein